MHVNGDIQVSIVGRDRSPRGGLPDLGDSGAERALRDDPGSSALGSFLRWVANIDRAVIHVDTASWIAAQKQPISGVFVTHLHFDHIAGLADVPHDVPVYTGPGEVGDTVFLNLFSRGSVTRALDGRAPIAEWPFQEDPDGRLDAVTDIFGDEMVCSRSSAVSSSG